MKQVKILHIISICILIVGFAGIINNLIVNPAKFPSAPMFVSGIGAMLSVAVSTNYLNSRRYEK